MSKAAKAKLRRFVLVTSLTCGTLGVLAPAAFAHYATITVNDCSSVTFNYYEFPATGTNIAPETVTINGNVVAAPTAQWSGTTTYTQTVPFNGAGDDGATLVASTSWTGAESDGVTGSQSLTQGLSGCAPTPTYTGRAYNVFASANLLGSIALLSPTYVFDTGSISTKSASNDSDTILSESLPPLGLAGGQLTRSVVTGGGDSTAHTSVNDLEVGNVDGIPLIATGEIESTSQTSCDESTGMINSTGGAIVAYLKIGGYVVAIPPTLTPDTTIPIRGVGSVTLNEQTPISDGLAVNAIDVRISTLGLITARVIIGHAESDVEGC